MSVAAQRPELFVEEVRRIADDVAAAHADEVDRDARFPAEAVSALREARTLSALVPVELGGAGVSFQAVAQACRDLGRRCGATGMVFAMHQIQVACVARHLEDAPWFEDYLRDLAAEQRLIASVTSEVGTGGDLGRSIAALEPGERGLLQFEKQAPTVSYGRYADDLLVTLRRTPETHERDQVLVLAHCAQATLTPLGEWDPLGMRGTCSPGFAVRAEISPEQVLAASFSGVASESMVPISHILWSHVWTGIAADAFDRARAFVRADAKRRPDSSGLAAQRLAQLATELSLLRAEVESGLAAFVEAANDESGREALASVSCALRFNNLKVAASEQAPRVCQGALSVCGIAGYLNNTPYSIGRHLRDTLSACIMVANERILQTNASLLLVAKDT